MLCTVVYDAMSLSSSFSFMRKPRVSSLNKVNLQVFKNNHYIIDLRIKGTILEMICNLGSINMYLLLYLENEINRMFVIFFFFTFFS